MTEIFNDMEDMVESVMKYADASEKTGAETENCSDGTESTVDELMDKSLSNTARALFAR